MRKVLWAAESGGRYKWALGHISASCHLMSLCLFFFFFFPFLLVLGRVLNLGSLARLYVALPLEPCPQPFLLSINLGIGSYILAWAILDFSSPIYTSCVPGIIGRHHHTYWLKWDLTNLPHSYYLNN
jgi:hypothetical protein